MSVLWKMLALCDRCGHRDDALTEFHPARPIGPGHPVTHFPPGWGLSEEGGGLVTAAGQSVAPRQLLCGECRDAPRCGLCEEFAVHGIRCDECGDECWRCAQDQQTDPAERAVQGHIRAVHDSNPVAKA